MMAIKLQISSISSAEANENRSSQYQTQISNIKTQSSLLSTSKNKISISIFCSLLSATCCASTTIQSTTLSHYHAPLIFSFFFPLFASCFNPSLLLILLLLLLAVPNHFKWGNLSIPTSQTNLIHARNQGKWAPEETVDMSPRFLYPFLEICKKE